MSVDAIVAGPLRVVLVDDHRLFRDGLRQLLNSDVRFEVVGEAASGEEFLEILRSYNSPRPLPLVFMDIDMPGMGGVEATRRAIEGWPELRVVALSMHGDREFYAPMVEAGAKGFLLKSSEFGEVAAAAQAVARGGTYFSPELMAALVEAMPEGGEAAGGGVWREALSEREAEVLPLVCEGLSNHEIAERLFISKRTVDKHRANILAKTGCKNTVSLVIYSVKNKLVRI
ncbi:MAG: response regulator transcription factor [Alistipes sp.]|jgi:DNA-binding NarL/FixJ family response regulator|nr:response regulator transcription factor [Alistipes sp.]